MKNLLLGAKIFFIAAMAMAFVACDKDDDTPEDESNVFIGTMVVSNSSDYTLADTKFTFDKDSGSLVMTNIRFSDASDYIPYMDITITGITESSADKYELDTASVSSNMTAYYTGTTTAFEDSQVKDITDLEIEIDGDDITVTYDCSSSSIVYIGTRE